MQPPEEVGQPAKTPEPGVLKKSGSVTEPKKPSQKGEAGGVPFETGTELPVRKAEEFPFRTDVPFPVSENEFDFGSREIRVAKDSKQHQFLELVTRHDDNLKDPITGRRYGCTVQAMERMASRALDDSAWKQSVFLSLMDRIDAYTAESDARGLGELDASDEEALTQEQKENREEVLQFDLQDMMRKAKLAFKESEVAKQYADDFEASYNALRLSRMERLQEARELSRQDSMPTWPPLSRVLATIDEEIREMQTGMRPSDWFRVQHLFAEESGRLLFSPHQVSRAGMYLDEDRWHKGPIRGTVNEIVSMLSVYVDGPASVKRAIESL